jgi:hypothetical protein
MCDGGEAHKPAGTGHGHVRVLQRSVCAMVSSQPRAYLLLGKVLFAERRDPTGRSRPPCVGRRFTAKQQEQARWNHMSPFVTAAFLASAAENEQPGAQQRAGRRSKTRPAYNLLPSGPPQTPLTHLGGGGGTFFVLLEVFFFLPPPAGGGGGGGSWRRAAIAAVAASCQAHVAVPARVPTLASATRTTHPQASSYARIVRSTRTNCANKHG